MAIRKLKIGKGMADGLAAKLATLTANLKLPYKLTVANVSERVKLVLPEVSNDIIAPGQSVTITVRNDCLAERIAADAAHFADVKASEKLVELSIEEPAAKATTSEASA